MNIKDSVEGTYDIKKYLTNESINYTSINPNRIDYPYCLALSKTCEDKDNALWTLKSVEQSDAGITVMLCDKDGKYLSIGNGTNNYATVEDAETTLTISYAYCPSNGAWGSRARIAKDDYYLCNHWGEHQMAFGYRNTSNDSPAATDSNVFWNIYEAPYAETQITFTGNKIGTTQVTVGNTTYNITVKPAPQTLQLYNAKAAWTADDTNAENNPNDCPMSKVIDGNTSSGYGEFGEDENTSSSYVQVDFQKVNVIYSINLYRFSDNDNGTGRKYHKTVIAVAEKEEDFKNGNAYIVYNADTDNTHGFGADDDENYPETSAGKSFELERDVRARYIRVYMCGAITSTGSTECTTNHVKEIQAIGYELSDNLPTLEMLVANAKMLQEDYYTETSWNAFQAALNTAKEVIENDEKAQSDATVNQAVEGLENAMEQLEGEIVLGIDETVTLKNFEGNYETEQITSDIVEVNMTGTSQYESRMLTKMSALTNGVQCWIKNQRANMLMTKTSSTNNNITGLVLTDAMSVGTVTDSGLLNHLWQIEIESDAEGEGGNTYYVKDGDSYLYMSADKHAGLGNKTDVAGFSIKNNDGLAPWRFKQGSLFLNDHMSYEPRRAAGWNGDSAENDAGSKWLMYKCDDNSYTDITFTGKTAGTEDVVIGTTTYHITVKGNELVGNDIVIDFGLPVTVEVEKFSTITAEEVVGTANYGTITVSETDDKTWAVKYTPDKVLLAADTVVLSDRNGKTYSFNVYPATSVYYDAGFATYPQGSSWGQGLEQAGTIGQTASVVTETGSGATYGFDAAYVASRTATSEKIGDSASFIYTGTGIDIYMNCSKTSGKVLVQIKDENSALEKMILTDTALIKGAADKETEFYKASKAYNVPIISLDSTDLVYGTHTVTMNHVRFTTEDTGANPLLMFDGFRVYDTLKTSETAAVIYSNDNELNPTYIKLRDQLIAALKSESFEYDGKYAEMMSAKIADAVMGETDAANGVVLIDGNKTGYTADDLQDFIDNSAKNELYLCPGQSLVFKVSNVDNLQLGLKTLGGEVVCSVSETEMNISSQVDMFYPINAVSSADGSVVTITNNSDALTDNELNAGKDPAILAITKLKAFSSTGTYKLQTLTSKDYMTALLSLGYESETGEGSGTDDVTPTPEVQHVNRLYGTDRYETSYAVAEEYKKLLAVEEFDAVVITTGKKSADALSGSYLAVLNNAPILLTNEKRVDEVVAYVQENLKAGGTVYVLGGDVAVPTAVDSALEADYTVKRLAGSDRYATNIMILEEAGVNGKELLIATGKDFADSLSASATKKPILLVKDEITDAHGAILRKYDGGKIYILGGEGAVSADVEAALVGHGQIFRVSGANRYETSVEIAKKFFEEPTAATLAYVKEAPDGLCGGPLAALLNAPLILTADEKTAVAAEYVQTEGIETGYIFGGDSRISNESVEEIF